ncbi:Aquaporin-4 (AQP-4) (Mercurial-insensitive water channel) (MIWC) (WCH4), partial [Durusdinium trenchii]
QFAVSLAVEFIGVMFFQILGGSADKDMAAWVNGIALAVWVYTAANISGGHLNPAVSISTCICGFYPVLHTVIYVVLQIVGAIIGALVTAFLVPGAEVQMGDGGPGCFSPKGGVTGEQVMWWECVMTFTLISCVYACGIAKPGHGSHTPLAVGLALFACAGSGGQYTGAALNPARVIGPMAIFGCGENTNRYYVRGQVLAAIFAMSVFAFVSGLGPLNPWMAKKAFKLSWREAAYFWITGSPPSRLQKTGTENINDFKQQYEAFQSEQSETGPQKRVAMDSLALNVALSTGVAADKVEEVLALLAEAEQTEHCMPDVVSYNTIIKAFAQRANYSGACEVLERMHAKKRRPNAITFNTVMDAAVRAGKPEEAWTRLQEMRKRGFKPDKFTCSILVKAFCKASSSVTEASVDRALCLLDEANECLDPTLKATLYNNVLEVTRKATEGSDLMML